jgi:head-tail adaptor
VLDYRDRITIQTAEETITSSGVTQTWSDVETRWARVVPLRPEAKAVYRQIGIDDVGFKVVFQGAVTCSLDRYRFVWCNKGSKILLPVEPPQDPDATGRNTTIEVKDTGQVDSE